MTFLYRYQDKERGVLESEIAASSQSDAYAVLRKRGVRPMQVWPKPGRLNRLSAIGKRGLAIVVLSLSLVALACYIALRPTSAPSDADTLAALPRQQLAPASVDFAFAAERVLAPVARPGEPVGEIDEDGFVADLRDALNTPLRPSEGESPSAVQLKRVVTGMKHEARLALENGDDPQLILSRLVERQHMEAAYRAGVLAEILREKTEEAKRVKVEKANRTLDLMGLRKIKFLEFTHFLTAETHLTPMNKGEGAFS